MNAPASRTRPLQLAAGLGLLWWLLSGRAEAHTLGLGAVSVLAVVWFARRMDLTDHEGVPMHITGRALPYWLWLAWQIWNSNLDVARRVLGAAPISPTVVRVPSTQRGALGQVLYANSITLTPGTVSMEVTSGHIEVHSLTQAAAHDLLAGDMCRRCTHAEGG